MSRSSATTAVPRLPACSPADFRARWVTPAEPVILSQIATSWPAFSRWTPASLAERFPTAPVQVMRAPHNRVDNSGAGGTTYDASTLGRYAAALASNAPDPGYLVTMWQDLPASLRDDVHWPDLCGEARWSQPTLWFGPAGIVSPMHLDVPDNLYVVVRGKKRFTLVSPRDSLHVSPHGIFSGKAQYARVDPERPEAHPRFARARTHIAELGDGDALYIPRRWWHHARGLEITLAVNFWWANGVEATLARAADAWKRLRGLSR